MVIEAMVSEFQSELSSRMQFDSASAAGQTIAETDYCHEVKEIVDAIVYLEDDLDQASLAAAAYAAQTSTSDQGAQASLNSLGRDLDVLKSRAKSLLTAAGCPAYEESY